MVIYLDSAQNRKGTPNENFAREVMELFTLGEGHYSEQDVKEAARAFTGWSLDRDSGQFVFRRFIHDDGVKTVLGKSGNFDGDDGARHSARAARDRRVRHAQTVARVRLARSRTSAEVDRIARRFRDSPLRHQGRAERHLYLRRVLREGEPRRRWSSRRSTWSSARCGSST